MTNTDVIELGGMAFDVARAMGFDEAQAADAFRDVVGALSTGDVCLECGKVRTPAGEVMCYCCEDTQPGGWRDWCAMQEELAHGG